MVAGSNTANAPANYARRPFHNPSYKPGSRKYSSIAADAAGNIWLFGGYGYDVNNNQGVMNDLFVYLIADREWIWISGSNTRNVVSNYGTRSLPFAQPGGRSEQSLAIDASGNLWIFGGIDSANNCLNDLWKYDNEWTWICGDIAANKDCIHGIKTDTAGTNMPRARAGQTLEADDAGDLWLFGGHGHDAGASSVILNDLWHYNESSGQWTWVANTPSSQEYPICFTDAAGNIWIRGDGDPLDENDLNSTVTEAAIRTGTNALIYTPMKLFDLSGRLIGQQVLISQDLYIDLHAYPPGTYLLQLADKTVWKVIKQ